MDRSAACLEVPTPGDSAPALRLVVDAPGGLVLVRADAAGAIQGGEDLPVGTLGALLRLVALAATPGAATGADGSRPSIPRAKRTAQGWHLFAAKRPRVWRLAPPSGSQPDLPPSGSWPDLPPSTTQPDPPP